MKSGIQILLFLSILSLPTFGVAKDGVTSPQWTQNNSLEPSQNTIPPWDDGEEGENELEVEDEYVPFLLMPLDPLLLSIIHKEKEDTYKPPYLDKVPRPPQG